MKITSKMIEVVNFCAKHLADQGRPCRDEDGACCYFDKETGNKCVVGCLIPATLYDNYADGKHEMGNKLEAESAHSLFDSRDFPEVADHLKSLIEEGEEVSITFYSVLQGYHDGNCGDGYSFDNDLLELLSDEETCKLIAMHIFETLENAHVPGL